MAGGWIKVEHSTPDKPEIMRIARVIGVTENEVLGALVRFWLWCDYQSRDGHAIGVTQLGLDRICGVTGMYGAMLDAGWLTEDESGVHVPNYEYHLAENAKARALAAKRKAKQRSSEVTQMSRSQRDNSVTREEKIREEKSIEENKQPPADDLRSAKEHVASWTMPANATDQTRELLAMWQRARKAQHGRYLTEAEWEPTVMRFSAWSGALWDKCLLASAAGGTKGIAEYAARKKTEAEPEKKPEPYWKPIPPIVDSPCRIAANKAWAAAKAAGKTDDEAFVEMTNAKNAVLAAERAS